MMEFDFNFGTVAGIAGSVTVGRSAEPDLFAPPLVQDYSSQPSMAGEQFEGFDLAEECLLRDNKDFGNAFLSVTASFNGARPEVEGTSVAPVDSETSTAARPSVVERPVVAPAEKTVVMSSADKPVVASVEKPVVASVEKPVVASVEKPVVASVEKPVVASVEKPVMASVEKPVVASVERPVVASVEKPVIASVEKPMVASVEKLVVASVDKPAVASVEKPVIAVTPVRADATATVGNPKTLEQPQSGEGTTVADMSVAAPKEKPVAGSSHRMVAVQGTSREASVRRAKDVVDNAEMQTVASQQVIVETPVAVEQIRPVERADGVASAQGVFAAAAVSPTEMVIATAEAIADSLSVTPGQLVGDGHVTVQLKADVLDGSVVQVDVSGSQVSVSFVSATPGAAQILSEHVGELRSHLQQALPAYVYDIAVAASQTEGVAVAVGQVNSPAQAARGLSFGTLERKRA